MDKVKSGEQFAPTVVVPKRGSHIRECCDCQVTINQHLEMNCKTTAEVVKLLGIYKTERGNNLSVTS